jgi:hypothetical protein
VGLLGGVLSFHSQDGDPLIVVAVDERSRRDAKDQSLVAGSPNSVVRLSIGLWSGTHWWLSEPVRVRALPPAIVTSNLRRPGRSVFQPGRFDEQAVSLLQPGSHCR